MAGHTPWRQIRRDPPDTPEGAARSTAYRRAMEDALRLEAQRQAGEVPWVAAPEGDDPYLATLRAYVEDLGGRLVLTVVFPDEPGSLAVPGAAVETDGAAVPAAPAGGQDH